MSKVVTAKEAVSHIKSGDHIYIHAVAGAPHHLINTLVQESSGLSNVHIYHLHTEGDAPYVEPQYEGVFNVHSFFVGPNVRKATWEGRADYIPVFISEIPDMIKRRAVPINVALVTVSPPDKNGFVSLGTSVEGAWAAVHYADLVIAQVNKYMPRTFGDSTIHIREINFLVEYDQPLVESIPEPCNEAEKKIGQYIADLVPNGATLQMGIGSMPNAVLQNLTNHKHLGVHTEMFSDGLLPLLESGVVDNSMKKLLKGRTVATFVMGSQKLYDFVHDNPSIQMKTVDYVNNMRNISKNPNVIGINSAIEIDLTGQVCADSIGTKIYSGVGGQIDFMRGAAMSDGGKPIIAISSRTAKGVAKIVPTLKVGAGVVSTRANIHYVVTEYGVAFLYGKSLKERAKLLIELAHPDDREMLEKAAFDRWNGHFEE
ncbi:MAG: acetyl-CoA hydrolase/transferase family protein [Saprospiraceae bacterium]